MSEAHYPTKTTMMIFLHLSEETVLMERKKVLVTGGLGYIGAHTVVALYEAGYEAILVDNLSNTHLSVLDGIDSIIGYRPAFYQVDCCDYREFKQVFLAHSDLAGVIHFAAFKSVGQSVKNPLSYYQNNINSTLTLLRLMEEFGVRQLVFSSSCTVYGQPMALPVTEKSPLLPANSPYGYTKQVCERIILDLYSSGNTCSAVLLRYFNPIGAHPSGRIGELPLGVPENLVPYITQTAAGIRSRLMVFGNDYNTSDGTCIRDYIHVCDLANAHVLAIQYMERNETGVEIFNLGSGSGYSVLELIRAFENSTGVSLDFSFADRRPGDVEKIYASCDKAVLKLGWACRYTMKDALAHAWQWEKALRKRV